MSKISEWFQLNSFKDDPAKFYFSLKALEDRPLKIMALTIKASKKEVLLGVKINSRLTFKN